MSTIPILHTTKFIIAGKSKFLFVGSIPEAMFCIIPAASKILEAYRKLPVSTFRPLTGEMREIIAEADKPKKGGKKKTTKECPSTVAATSKKRKTKVGSSAPVPPPIKKLKTKKVVRLEVEEPIQHEDTDAIS